MRLCLIICQIGKSKEHKTFKSHSNGLDHSYPLARKLGICQLKLSMIKCYTSIEVIAV